MARVEASIRAMARANPRMFRGSELVFGGQKLGTCDILGSEVILDIPYIYTHSFTPIITYLIVVFLSPSYSLSPLPSSSL